MASRRTRGPIDNISFGAPIWPVINHSVVFRMLGPFEVVIMIGRTLTYSAMLKDRDYDVTPHIIAHIDSKCAGGGSVKEWEVEMVVEECEVDMVGEECEVGGNVDCSA